MGLGYVKGLTRQSADASGGIAPASGHPSASADDLVLRVPSAHARRELTRLAQIGALNQLEGTKYRRDALWQVERAGKLEGPLLRQESRWLRGYN